MKIQSNNKYPNASLEMVIGKSLHEQLLLRGAINADASRRLGICAFAAHLR
jgi:hypothetical protein